MLDVGDCHCSSKELSGILARCTVRLSPFIVEGNVIVRFFGSNWCVSKMTILVSSNPYTKNPRSDSDHGGANATMSHRYQVFIGE